MYGRFLLIIRRGLFVLDLGGGYIWESLGDRFYYGARMAARGNVVVVSVEYRLGAFGFSYFDDVRAAATLDCWTRFWLFAGFGTISLHLAEILIMLLSGGS